MEHFDTRNRLAQAHHDAAAQFAEAAHHHRAAAFELARGEKELAKAHAVAAESHAKFGAEAAKKTLSKISDYDLDVKYDVKKVEDAHPMITSHSLCTPGCGHTGTRNSFCC
jgi:gallidermin/nisin family lantibiotic